MDSKISSDFWSDPVVENLSSELKLAALWMLTNSRISLCGYAEVSKNRFGFETGLNSEDMARAIEALPKTFIACGKGYVVRAFIKRQFGHGRALARSHMSTPVVNAMLLCPADVVSLLLGWYPELEEKYNSALEKSYSSPSEALPKVKEQEQEQEQEQEKEQEQEQEQEQEKGARPAPRSRARAKRPGHQRPADVGGVAGERMLALGRLLRRQEGTAWAPDEIEAMAAAGLDTLSADDFQAQIEPMGRYYGANIPRETDYRRRDLLRLLRHWPGELDRARKWCADNSAGSGLKFVN